MKRGEIREFLFRYYCKRSASFLANIYKASITADSKDIHRARLDVKKILALYGLFELLDPETFRKKIGYKLFRSLYHQAGKIREIQVNYLLLNELESLGPKGNAFIQWLGDEEQKAIRKFIRSVKKFSETELKDAEKEIKRICHRSSIAELSLKTKTFLKDKASLIRQLQSEEPGDKELHRIRQNLKAISTLTTLVSSIRPGQHLDQIITALNKTELMIGDWHDRIVLKDAIERFLEKNTPGSAEEVTEINRMRQNLVEGNLKLVRLFMPEVNAIVDSVLAI